MPAPVFPPPAAPVVRSADTRSGSACVPLAAIDSAGPLPGGLLVVTLGVAVPNQFPLKFFGFAPGAGSEPPVWRSTIPPYQLPLKLLSENVELIALCTGELLPPLASRKTMPTV